MHIIGANLLTKCHEDRKINVALEKNAPPPYIIGMNLLGKFYEERTVYVVSRVLTRLYYSHIRKNAPPKSHVFQANIIIFQLIQDIIMTNLLTKFHEDWTINIASRVKNAPPLFHDDRKINMTSRVLTRWPYIIEMTVLTKFHEDRTINVPSRVKNAPPLRSHVVQANITIFELIQDINTTYLLTMFREDWTVNVASRELTRQMLTPYNAQRTTHDGQKAITKAHHEHVLLR
ncbi:hypothetical protein DPMN_028694 [Dreissena polymorpha]|uniref:Uncharacterized protein n=1 Tax=Dreissena polymorpha TaxID=45954 RepID=A0A9D4RGD5_DREPO|nr:hypothetical protein DPMN_028694 [Dreissena polymorpha]